MGTARDKNLREAFGEERSPSPAPPRRGSGKDDRRRNDSREPPPQKTDRDRERRRDREGRREDKIVAGDDRKKVAVAPVKGLYLPPRSVKNRSRSRRRRSR